MCECEKGGFFLFAFSAFITTVYILCLLLLLLLSRMECGMKINFFPRERKKVFNKTVRCEVAVGGRRVKMDGVYSSHLGLLAGLHLHIRKIGRWKIKRNEPAETALPFWNVNAVMYLANQPA